MPILGYGTYTIKDPEEVYSTLDAALEAGYRSIDTATVYQNEEAIGAALEQLLPKHNLTREKIFITSKLSPAEQGAGGAKAAVERSLSRLQTDYLDLYLIHWPGSRLPSEAGDNARLRSQSWQALCELVKGGKLRSIGVSNYTDRHLKELLASSSHVPAVNQIEAHPYWKPTTPLLQTCAENKILIQAYSSLGGRRGEPLLSDPVVEEIAHHHDVTPAQVLLRWALEAGYEKFEELPSRGKPGPEEWTMLAGVVVQDGSFGKVVSLATGTRSLGAKFYHPDLILDSHAEVLARRGFLKVLYNEVEAEIKSEKNGEVVKRTGWNLVERTTKCNKSIRLRCGLCFHLFTSQAPCGDAAIVDSSEPLGPEAAIAGVPDIHRTGAPIAVGPPDPKMPGAGYHILGAVRFKPGRGPPSLSFSCSDKIARWIHCGLQGALLSRLIEGKVHVASVTVGGGSQFSAAASLRALLRPGPDYPVRLSASQHSFPSARRLDARPCPTSIVWTHSSPMEVEICVDGRRQGSTAKRPVALSISKKVFFEKFLKLSGESSNLGYLAAKQAALEYQTASKKFKSARSWPSKTPSDFTL